MAPVPFANVITLTSPARRSRHYLQDVSVTCIVRRDITRWSEMYDPALTSLIHDDVDPWYRAEREYAAMLHVMHHCQLC